jgi:hypothetical protein
VHTAYNQLRNLESDRQVNMTYMYIAKGKHVGRGLEVSRTYFLLQKNLGHWLGSRHDLVVNGMKSRSQVGS